MALSFVCMFCDGSFDRKNIKIGISSDEYYCGACTPKYQEYSNEKVQEIKKRNEERDIKSKMIDPKNLIQYRSIQKNNINDKIYCHCTFDFKDEVKKLGFKWDKNMKLWYITKNDLTYEKYIRTQKIRYTNFTTIGALNYYYV